MRFSYTRLLLLSTLVTGSFLLSAQRNCGTMDLLEQQIQQDPSRLDRLNQLERFTQDFVPDEAKALTTIPVVVHVVYNGSTQNISAAQIQSQIQVLNDDFRRLNGDAENVWSQAADSEIEFCLATVDPNGNATSGIVRVPTTRTGFGTNDAVKSSSIGGSNAWPAGKYLNVWVCNIGGGILGYAQFPGGPASTDGVVCDYRYFGTTGTATAPFNLGRTMTHEVGHYLNLRHIWGDGGCGASDFVSDTPDADGSNDGCRIGSVSCNSVDMVQNYMDYSDDACMNLFTQGQKNRMQAALAGARSSLGNSNACGTPGGGGGCSDTQVTLTLVTDNYGSETSWSLSGPSGVVASGSGYGNNQTITETFCLPDGCYDFTVNDSYGDGICCAHGNGSYTLSGSGVSASGGNFGATETKNFCSGNSGGGNSGGGNSGGGGDGGGACSDVTFATDNFEGGYGNWNDGGSDCVRSRTRPIQGSRSVYLRDNTNSSVLTSDAYNLDDFEEVTVAFSYYPFSMENGEDFWLQVDNGSGFQTVETWVSGIDFNNNTRYNESVTITGDFGTNARIRFRCDASTDSDYVHFDNVVLSGCTRGTNRTLNNNDLAEEWTDDHLTDDLAEDVHYSLFPNPAREAFLLTITEEGYTGKLTTVDGRILAVRPLVPGHNRFATEELPAGVYLLVIEGAEYREVDKVVIR